MINQYKYQSTDPASNLKKRCASRPVLSQNLDFKCDYRVKPLGKDVCDSGLSLRFVILGHVDVGKSV